MGVEALVRAGKGDRNCFRPGGLPSPDAVYNSGIMGEWAVADLFRLCQESGTTNSNRSENMGGNRNGTDGIGPAVEAVRRKVAEVLASLNLREREMLCMLCAKGGAGLTPEEAGRLFRFSRGRVRQIEAKALRKLRRPVCIRKPEEVAMESRGRRVDIPSGFGILPAETATESTR